MSQTTSGDPTTSDDGDSSSTTGDGGDTGTSTTTGGGAASSSSTGTTMCIDQYETNEDDQDAAMADIGQTLNATICDGDVDWYVFTNNAMSNVAVDLMFGIGDGNLDLYVLDDALTEVGSSTGGSGLEAVHLSKLVAGTYFVRVELAEPQPMPGDINYTLAFYTF